ncbi:MAG: amidohydrolase [Chloroflexi bacterium]|nr:amidohydrolase [Chloroflexota bacterium]
MPTPDELKAIALRRIDAHKDEVIRIAKLILQNPEPGFYEAKTSRLVAQKLTELGIPHRTGIALTGIKGYLECRGGPGPTVAVLGELDSLRVPDHPYADKTTGAAHACGHHAQIGMLFGAIMGLMAPEVLSTLSGRIALIAVPAEEFIDVEYRYGLYQEGKLGLLSGKQEFIRIGEFDDVEMAMMCHTTSSPEDGLLGLGGTSNGHVVKYIQFLGKAAHAGSAPHRGINALNAATIALNAIHAQRETFKNEDTIRVHGILTRGGAAVSSVPADVRLEWRCRGSTVESVEETSARVDRCLRAGALAVGGQVRIVTLAGYLPLINDSLLMETCKANAERLVGRDNVAVHPANRNRGGSTDMGDLSQIMPAVHPYAGGATGVGHGNDYVVQDYEQAVVNPAKAMAMTVIDLLADGATRAREVLARSKPPMTREQYLALQARRMREELYEGR